MAITTENELTKVRSSTDLVVALAGNPNVGKSSIFNQLTGLGVVTANYPGKTVEINVATTHLDGRKIGIVDLPGTYALGAVSDDQWVARQVVLEDHPDVVMAVVDATNLARNLYIVLQFLDLGFPVVVALNVIDEAEREGISTDASLLSELLGIPVIATVATAGKGLNEALRSAVDVARQRERHHAWPSYGHDVASVIEDLARFIESRSIVLPYGLPPRAIAVLLLEEDAEFVEAVRSLPGGQDIIDYATELGQRIENRHGEPSALRIARERHGLAGTLASQAQTFENERGALVDRLWRYTTSPKTGLPILLVVLGIVFGTLFFVGEFLSRLLGDFWAAFVSPLIQAGVFQVFGDGTLGKIMLWGPDAGIQAALSVGIPYVMVFYLMLAVLEDTGYLNSAAFLTDRVMHRFGLHSQAVISLVAGAGCSVPAVIGTRSLTTMRERVIASTLVVMIPCSARTAVILGAVALFVGWQAALLVYGIVFVIIALAGIGLNKVMPGESSGLVMEVFPFRIPSVRSILKKTWMRLYDFIFVAMPIVLVGSLVLGALYETGWVWYLVGPLSPVVEGWLGLPAVAGLALIFAVMRKELALQLVVALAAVQFGSGAGNLLQFMSANQIITYALVNTLYIPCLATIAVLGRELGWRRTVMIAIFTIAVAVTVGGLAHRGLMLVGWS